MVALLAFVKVADECTFEIPFVLFFLILDCEKMYSFRQFCRPSAALEEELYYSNMMALQKYLSKFAFLNLTLAYSN